MRTVNLRIEQLTERLNALKSERTFMIEEIQTQLVAEYHKLFDADAVLQKDIENALNASEYMLKEDGLYTWFRVKFDLTGFTKETQQYLENYLSDHGLYVDWETDCFESYQGDDFISIQDDARRGDNGVWQGHKMIIEEAEYTNEDGEIDTEKRNAMIEAHMKKTGCFPGVFRVTQYGGVYFVNTQNKN